MKKYNFDITVTDNTYAGGLELPYVSAAILGAAQGQMQRNGDIPPEWTDFLLTTVAAKTGEHLETLMWAGDAGAVFGTGFLSNDGVIDEAGIDASACADFVEATTSAAFTAVNILAQMGIVFDGAASVPGILTKPGAGFYISYEAYSFFVQALAANNTIVSYDQGFAAPTYLGYPVYPTQGLGTADVMVFTYPDNLVVATNNYTADTSAALIPVYAYDGSDNVKVKLHFAVGVQTAVPGDGVVGFVFT